jgi:hypothetical protein
MCSGLFGDGIFSDGTLCDGTLCVGTFYEFIGEFKALCKMALACEAP